MTTTTNNKETFEEVAVFQDNQAWLIWRVWLITYLIAGELREGGRGRRRINSRCDLVQSQDWQIVLGKVQLEDGMINWKLSSLLWTRSENLIISNNYKQILSQLPPLPLPQQLTDNVVMLVRLYSWNNLAVNWLALKTWPCPNITVNTQWGGGDLTLPTLGIFLASRAGFAQSDQPDFHQGQTRPAPHPAWQHHHRHY